MKSILFGDSKIIGKVYPKPILDILKREAGLNPEVIENQDLPDRHLDTSDTEYIFTTWGMPQLNAEEIRKYFPRLEALFYAAGSVQSFARPFLEQNVRVFSAWAANGIPVAEYAFAQILLANKNFYTCARYSSAGDNQSARKAAERISGNYGCKAGIIGVGMIGRMVIQSLKRHDIEVLVFDPFLPDKAAEELGAKKVSLQRLFSECQTISNHLANNPQTVGILNYDLFSLMIPNAVFINTGRGAQVVEPDLCRILAERTDITAVLDVTWPEPPEPGHPFYTLPNAVLTPHIAGSMGREVERMSRYMLEEFRRFRTGEPCLYEVTMDMLNNMA